MKYINGLSTLDIIPQVWEMNLLDDKYFLISSFCMVEKWNFYMPFIGFL